MKILPMNNPKRRQMGIEAIIVLIGLSVDTDRTAGFTHAGPRQRDRRLPPVGTARCSQRQSDEHLWSQGASKGSVFPL